MLVGLGIMTLPTLLSGPGSSRVIAWIVFVTGIISVLAMAMIAWRCGIAAGAGYLGLLIAVFVLVPQGFALTHTFHWRARSGDPPSARGPAGVIGMSGDDREGSGSNMWTRPVQIRATYSSVSAPAGHPELSRRTPVNLTVQLDIPASVSPGSIIILRGTVSVQIPEPLRVLIRYWRDIDTSSDNLTFPVTINGKTVVLEASRLQTGVMSAKSNPLIVSGAVSTQALQIPLGTTGNIVIDLPHNGTVRSPINQAPAAFTLQLRATGGPLIKRDVTSHMACSAPENRRLTIISIPVGA